MTDSARIPDRVEQHELGGTVSYFTLSNGLIVSVLGDGYRYADDYELHQRDLRSGEVVPYTEQRADTWEGIWALLDTLESQGAEA